MIHIIYIYIIINAFMLGILEDTWSNRSDSFRNNLVGFLILSIFGTIFGAMQLVVNLSAFFYSDIWRDIRTNVKYAVFTKSATTKLLKSSESPKKYYDTIVLVLEHKLKLQNKSIVDLSYILGAKRIVKYITKNNIQLK